MISVEVLPDPATDALARAAWKRLIDAGLPSAGRHTGESNRPHITVAVRESPALDGLADLADLLPLTLRMGGVLLFPRSGQAVIAWQVVVTTPLAQFHRRVAAAVGPADERYAHTAPDDWTPHLTMARRVRLADLGAAVEAIDLSPHVGQITGLRIWDATSRTVTTLR
ncbi:2'-5' RNA ligase family protein [Microbacterium sp. ET2]|uniref:2'-5' RNA ligase family protein n=1 Tax=Microbacterium albipurpureum TaxID=3050384 RepID=UPI00259CDCD9|nr:2'-5' RNA ligase family protein [Microbacterium sp. ET2 (Ac-2212)]WJL96316.1 2'-5' RNA ligase family protein [Microbacterium sp. ET2 (Ac-2212)]